MFVLLSVKLDCVIGQSFQKVVQVAHTVFPGKESFAHLFIKAIERYPSPNLQKQDERSGGKLAKKIEAFQQKNVEPDQSYDDVFRLLFPELFAQ
ncbi:hypothetical protein VF13_39310 [Nostoc linckia z16]|nr:hypothetical protein VF13_39310 [Nostoc linckia z16]